MLAIKYFTYNVSQCKDAMIKLIKLTTYMLLVFVLVQGTTQNCLAQNNDGLEALVEDTKSDLLIVVGGGLAGAVLGLSTLSFVEEPKEHTRNIVVGASIGIIAGVAYVAFNQANKSREAIYGIPEEASYKNNPKRFDTSKRVSWHYSNQNSNQNQGAIPSLTPYQLNFSFNY